MLSENEDLLYITLLDKKLKFGHVFLVVKVNIALYSVAITHFSQLYVKPWRFCRS